MQDLPPDLDQYIQQKIADGEFASAEEFAIVAMQLYRELDNRHELIKAEVRAGVEQADRGECTPLDMDEIKRELTEELDEQGQPR